jgi:hypothetical protein
MSDAISAIYSSQSIGDITCLLVKGYLYPKYITQKEQSHQELCGAIFLSCAFEKKVMHNSITALLINEWHKRA